MNQELTLYAVIVEVTCGRKDKLHSEKSKKRAVHWRNKGIHCPATFISFCSRAVVQIVIDVIVADVQVCVAMFIRKSSVCLAR